MKELTIAELNMLQKIYAYTTKNDRPPQNKDLVIITGYSKSTISELVTSLIQNEAITRQERDLLLNDRSYGLLEEHLSERLTKMTELMNDFEVKRVEASGKVTVGEETYGKFNLSSREDKLRYDIPKTNKPKTKKQPVKDTQMSKLKRILGWKI